jgi:hypothetical protein
MTNLFRADELVLRPVRAHVVKPQVSRSSSGGAVAGDVFPGRGPHLRVDVVQRVLAGRLLVLGQRVVVEDRAGVRRVLRLDWSFANKKRRKKLSLKTFI